MAKTLSIGTRSVLFGVHQFLLHPVLIAIGWWKAYGGRRVLVGQRTVAHPFGGWWEKDVYTSLVDPRLWLAFVVHDLGYVGKPDMDGSEGETHPEFGAAIMRRLFGEPWGDFVLLHSRYYAKRLGRPLSPLCVADKWVIILEPSWLYLPRVWASGELREFMEVAQKRAASPTSPTDPLTEAEKDDFRSGNPWRWHRALRTYMRRWITAHADGRPDTWTRVRHPQPATPRHLTAETSARTS